MKLGAKADVFIPDGSTVESALSRTTHLCICAHQDDMEIFAFHGIAECFNSTDRWFTGVVVTDGAGSARNGGYADYTDEMMQQIRMREQRKAAAIGEYSALIQLGHPSSTVKNNSSASVKSDLISILQACRPQILYLHNPADKHDTHVAVLSRCIEAVRSLPQASRPASVYGCEVWRGLDWLCDKDKSVLPLSGLENLAAALIGVFDSQISGGKRYDLATAGRRLSNATYLESHATDSITAATYTLDLTPLVKDDHMTLEDFTLGFIERFKADVTERILRFN
ncbi:MAG: PIG-L family deacetylase [Candidatus Wallbacteria bacterium]|nr:PIG-L family deacetylase [Candidatus Wallbacteria bacterium]